MNDDTAHFPSDMKRALKLFIQLADGECGRYTVSECSDEKDWSPYAIYTSQRWCPHCIAKAALEGRLPRPHDAPMGVEIICEMEGVAL